MRQLSRGWSSGCSVCGGPADEVEVSLEFWRGGLEPLIISACQDADCVAHYPTVSHGDVSRSD